MSFLLLLSLWEDPVSLKDEWTSMGRTCHSLLRGCNDEIIHIKLQTV